MLGTVSSSLISVVLLLLASRFLDSKRFLIFLYCLCSWSAVFVLGYFQVRNPQSTDVKKDTNLLLICQLETLRSFDDFTSFIYSMARYLVFTNLVLFYCLFFIGLQMHIQISEIISAKNRSTQLEGAILQELVAC